MIKVIASDMDGTLLGLDHKVAPRTLEAIHSAQEQGIRFMITRKKFPKCNGGTGGIGPRV